MKLGSPTSLYVRGWTRCVCVCVCVLNTYTSVQEDLKCHNCAELGEEKVVNILF